MLERVAMSIEVLRPDELLYEGIPLKIIFHQDGEQGLHIDRERGLVYVNTVDRHETRELVRRFFLRESSAYVVKRVRELAPLLGVRALRVDVREIGKWGYCTRDGRLSFSWQIAALPERLREYVVLHELTHLVEFNHSGAFRRRLKEVCHDFRDREKELGRIVPYERLEPPA